MCAIVNAVNFAYKNYDARTLELVLQALFNVMNNILVANGGNGFPIPHQGTRKAQQAEMLGWNVAVNRIALENVKRNVANQNIILANHEK